MTALQKAYTIYEFASIINEMQIKILLYKGDRTKAIERVGRLIEVFKEISS